MLGDDLLKDLREAVGSGTDDWHHVSHRLRAAVPDGEAERYQPYIDAFEYLLLRPSQEDAREQAGGPFGPMIMSGGGQVPPPLDQAGDVYLAAWAEAADVLAVPMVKARLNDLLWVRRAQPAPHLRARQAIDSYLELAALSGRHVVERMHDVERAIEIARQLRDGDRLVRALGVAEEMVRITVEPDSGAQGIARSLLATMAAVRPEDRPAAFPELLARAEVTFDDDAAAFEAILDLRAATIGGDDIRARQVARWRKAAEDEETPQLRLVRLERAHELALTHGLNDVANEILLELQKIKPEDVATESFSESVTITDEEMAELVSWFVEPDDWRVGLLRLGADEPSGQATHEIDAFLDQQQRDFPLLSLFSKSVMGTDSAASAIKATDDEKRRVLDRAQHRSFLASFQGFVIAEALQRIETKHGRPTRDALVEFFAGPNVDEDQADRIARSLELFWDGETDEAAHLLVPRLEAIVRTVARRIGIPIIKLPSGDKVGGSRTLGAVLIDLNQALPEPWGDYLFNLLADPLGHNLRNRIAHGLVAKVGSSDAALLIQVACFLSMIGPRNEA